MKFYDRKEEIALLERIVKQSREQSRMTVLVGRRRIGKTELAKRCGDSLVLYFFVARKAESLLCDDFVREAEAKLGIPIGHFTSVATLFGYLLQLSAQRPFTIIMDEFQDFYRVNPAVFSEIQNQWDRYKDQGHLNLIISGSIFTMMKHIFEDSKEPLFSRAQKKITVLPFKTVVLKTILKDYNPHYTPDDLLTLYAITGGVDGMSRCSWTTAIATVNRCSPHSQRATRCSSMRGRICWSKSSVRNIPPISRF